MLSSASRFLQLKRYQYEVTYSLYMLTPAEKFIFNSILFFALSLLILAASMYLPRHVSFIVSRAFYYYGGDEALFLSTADATLKAATTITA